MSALDSTPFFRRQGVKSAIKHIAQARKVTLFVGAGVGTEIGLPDWPLLVRRLLADAIAGADGRAWERPLRSEHRELVDLVIERESLLSAATIAKARLGPRFKRALHRALYRHEWGDEELLYVPSSGAEYGHLRSTTFEAVAAIYRAFVDSEEDRWSCDIVTTNYDLSLEEALAREKVEAVPWFEDGDPPEQSRIEHVVRHLHGFLTPELESERLILTEADYHEAGAKGVSWQESYLRRRLKESTVLFVGTSLADPDILSILFRSAEIRERAFALLVEKKESKALPDIPAGRDPREDAFEELSSGRWRTAGLTVLRADYVAQPRQFLWEVAMKKRNPDAPAYGERLTDWYRRAAANVPLALGNQHDFIETQNKLSKIAWRMLEQVRNFVREDGHDSIDGEALAIHVWSRSTLPLQIGEMEGIDLCAMSMIVCSDRAWRSPQAVDTRRVMLPTRRAALEAFCERRVIERSHDGSFQWNYVLAVPVVIEEREINARLPVGAVTLESTSARDESLLPLISQKTREEVVEYLRGSAGWMLGNTATALVP